MAVRLLLHIFLENMELNMRGSHRISLSIKQAAEGGELAEEYRKHFEVDEHGNWSAGADDASREATWAEYYGEGGEGAAAAAAAAEAAEAAPEA
jgi:small subunit ribosomal protein S1